MARPAQFRDFRQRDLLPGQVQSLSGILGKVVGIELEQRHSLSTVEWRVLAHIATGNPEDDAPLTAQTIASRTGIDKGWVSRAITRLLARDLIERERDTIDSRRHLLNPTIKGIDLFEAGVITMRQLQSKLLDAFDEAEHTSFVRLFTRLQREAETIYQDQMDLKSKRDA